MKTENIKKANELLTKVEALEKEIKRLKDLAKLDHFVEIIICDKGTVPTRNKPNHSEWVKFFGFEETLKKEIKIFEKRKKEIEAEIENL